MIYTTSHRFGTRNDFMETKNWKKDKLRASQPFFVLDSESFIQESYRKMGISHFYMIRKEKGVTFRAIPDGCIDFIFSYSEDGLKASVLGTPLSAKDDMMGGDTDMFGVRFLPGVRPTGLTVKLKDLADMALPLKDFYTDEFDFDGLYKLDDFISRVRFFLSQYKKLEKREPKPYGKEALFNAVCDMIYHTDGQIRISDLAVETSYSERYIRKVFMEEMGFSPKKFCSILRLQRAIEFINYGYDEDTADWATDLGYYDQSQCIRDFRRYLGMTPRQYRKLVRDGDYVGRAVYAHDIGLKI
ncbi:MAG: AraC family transcriptional regulator [bacterium LCO1.1]|uniref:AraC family transcriptional regulator n=1 Tax=Candidatus Weimeria bifida TaxID=2599074 RepID=A0A6N7IYH5_9FIRM|nr:AraC family transcriptional regulator [Candidatus Weimeria bifida]